MMSIMRHNRQLHRKRRVVAVVLAVMMAMTMMPAMFSTPYEAEAATALKKPTNIHRYKLRTTTKAWISWNKVSGATGYSVFKKVNGEYRIVKSTHSTKMFLTGLKRTNHIRIYAYKKSGSKTVARSESSYAKITMPKVIKSGTRGYTQTYGYRVIKKAKTRYGARYVWGASGPNKFDCSGFTYWTMKYSGVDNVRIGRSSAQGYYNTYKRYKVGSSLKYAQSGDMLLFSKSGRTRGIFHVGIYDKNGYYVHANGKKVTRSRVPSSQLCAVIRLKGLK